MARIPDDVVERLKREVSLERLVESAGVELRGRGRDRIGCCPFHDDREPSLVVSPDKNLWHCLGVCAAGGSVFDWVMRAEGVSFRHAVELLRDGFTPSRLVAAGGVKVAAPPGRSTVARLDAPFTGELSDAEVLERVIGFYHATLKESPEALGYLRDRRCGSAEVIDRFRLGFANRTLGYRIPASNRAEGGELRRRLQELGVLRASGHEHLRGSLVIPITDAHGRVVELYGRKIGGRLRRGTALHCYLPGPQHGVFNLEAFGACDELVVCESLIDALSFWCAGFRNVTSAYGVNGFTDDHHAALREHSIGRVLFAYDNDPAGNRAAGELAQVLIAEGVECFRVVFPDGADANDVAVASASPTDALGKLIRSARWMGKGTGPATRRLAGSLREPAPASPATPAPTEPSVGVLDALGEIPDVSPERSASPIPAGPVPGVEPSVSGEEMVVVLGDRRWRVRGLSRNTSFDVLRVNVLVSKVGYDVFHADTLDLYSARARAAFVAAAAGELHADADVVKRDLGRVMLAAEAHVEEAIRAAQQLEHARVELDPDERAAALELLRDPKLVDRIVADFERCGIVGEATNLLVAYLAATSRLLERPLAVVVQSTSAAGKSQLLDAVLAFVPGEDLVRFSAMTGQSLYYLGERDLAHKVLAVAEQQGAERAAYALKLLQSEGELSIASTGKDATSGKLVTHEYRVAGPTAIFLTTTAIDVDEELLSRCLVLSVDEDRAQTRAIHARQRQAHTLDGLVAAREAETLIKLHRDAQRLLEPIAVVNPFAERLGFSDAATRTRRDHVKYLTLISTIALLHQHQRPRQQATVAGQTISFVEATAADVELANRLAHEVLGRSLDELPPQTRRLLGILTEAVNQACAQGDMKRCDVRFTRRDVRAWSGWSDFQVRTHLGRLVDLEYVLVHAGGRGRSFVYELLYDTDPTQDAPRLPGLVDPTATTPNLEESENNVEGSSRGQRALFEASSSTDGNGSSPARTSPRGRDDPRSHISSGAGGVVVHEQAG